MGQTQIECRAEQSQEECDCHDSSGERLEGQAVRSVARRPTIGSQSLRTKGLGQAVPLQEVDPEKELIDSEFSRTDAQPTVGSIVLVTGYDPMRHRKDYKGWSGTIVADDRSSTPFEIELGVEGKVWFQSSEVSL